MLILQYVILYLIGKVTYRTSEEQLYFKKSQIKMLLIQHGKFVKLFPNQYSRFQAGFMAICILLRKAFKMRSFQPMCTFNMSYQSVPIAKYEVECLKKLLTAVRIDCYSYTNKIFRCCRTFSAPRILIIFYKVLGKSELNTSHHYKITHLADYQTRIYVGNNMIGIVKSKTNVNMYR